MQRTTPCLVLAAALAVVGCDARPAPRTLEAQTGAIINGTDESGSPAVGALVQQFGSFRQSFCTGTLIRPNWVLTAAHCVDGMQLNSTAFFIGANASRNGTSVSAKSFHIHPRYTTNPAAVLYDIALMELESDVPANVAEPIPYNVEPLEAEVGKSVTYIGYGVSDGQAQTGGGQKRRTQIPLDRVDPLSCSSKFEGTGVCFGDSGGPGLLEISGQTRVISVNSTVNGCEGDDCDPCKGTGSNYTRVDVFADWIASVLGENFEKCTDQVALCDCPAACQADGVCDNAVCPTATCQSALDCIIDDCDLGADGSCAQACAQPASQAALTNLGALIECAAEQCLEAETAEENRTCFAERCSAQLTACTAPAGAQTCSQAAACAAACADATCVEACAKGATVDAQTALEALRTCQAESCASETGAALAGCLAAACPTAYEGCYPPDHCSPDSPTACPVGYVCAVTPTGETSCQEQADVPDADAGVPPGDGDPSSDGNAGDGDTDGASEETDGTDTGGEPIAMTPRSSDSGCQMSPARNERPSMLWLALFLGAGALVRRRARAR